MSQPATVATRSFSLPWFLSDPEVLDRVAFVSLIVAIAFTPLSESIKNVAFGLAIFAGGLSVVGRKPPRLIMTYIGWFHLLFFAVAGLSALQGIDTWLGLRGTWDIFRYFVFFVLTVNLCRTEKRVLTVVAAFVVSTTLGAVLGLGNYGFYKLAKWSGKQTPSLLAVHVHSLGHPNHTATYLLMIIALCAGVRIYLPTSRRIRLGLEFSLVVLLIALIMTYSRSALVTLFFFLFILICYFRKKRVLMSFVGVLLVSILIWGVLGGQGKKNLGEILQPWKSPAIRERLILWSALGSGMVQDRPFFGAGPRNFNQIDKRRYGLSSGWDYYNHAHSTYFSVLTEMGLLGLGSFLLWLGAGLVVWWSVLFGQPSGLGKVLALGYLGAFIALTVSGLVTTTLHTEGAIAYSSMLGLLVAWTKLKDVGLSTESCPQEQCR